MLHFAKAFLISLSALACQPEPLRLTTPEGAEDPSPVAVLFRLEGNTLHARFEVSTSKINAPEKLPAGAYPYQFDVVELFFSVEGKPGLPYYEIELSPYGATFFVKIHDPRKPFENNVSLPVAHKATLTERGWEGEFSIELDRMGWQGDPSKIVGNAFSIQGEKPNRRYYSLFLPGQQKPSFHQPAFFRPLPICAQPATVQEQ